MKKITIVGAGRVGESTAQFMATRELAREIMLIDIREGAAAGAALDIQESSALFGFDTRVSGDTRLSAMAGSDLVIVTAGVPRKPGMSRSDVLQTNLAVIEEICDGLLEHAPEAMLVMVTNPVDVLTYRAWLRTGWPRNRVFGLPGVLDAARMATFVSLESGFSARDVYAMVLGGHGDAMVPLPRYTCVHGIPVTRLLAPEVIERIVERTRNGGAEILALKKTSSAYDAPAAAITRMVDGVVHQRRTILPCVAILDGEYGLRDIAMGVPVVLDETGASRIIELALTDEERAAFEASADSVRRDLAQLAGA